MDNLCLVGIMSYPQSKKLVVIIGNEFNFME